MADKSKQVISKDTAMHLYNVLGSAKNRSLEMDKKVAIIMLQGKLKAISDEQRNIVDETKKTASETEFQSIVIPALNKWGQEETEIETKILTAKDFEALIGDNDFSVSDQTVLYNNLIA